MNNDDPCTLKLNFTFSFLIQSGVEQRCLLKWIFTWHVPLLWPLLTSLKAPSSLVGALTSHLQYGFPRGAGH